MSDRICCKCGSTATTEVRVMADEFMDYYCDKCMEIDFYKLSEWLPKPQEGEA